MQGLKKSKRITWASDDNLCQERLFLSDESPSRVGLGGQDLLQAKSSWLPQQAGMGSDDSLPPGFEGTTPTSQLKNSFSNIPLIKWRCPPRIVVDVSWLVVAGEESKEVETQKQREMRMLEAIYPRPSAIPPNPSLLMGIEASLNNDQNTPLIPLTPIEEEDAALDASMSPTAQTASSVSPHSNGAPPPAAFPGVDPEVAAAAAAALSAVSSNQGNLVDQNLLIKILSDPKLVERLITDHRASANAQFQATRPPGAVVSEPPPHLPMNRMDPTHGGPYYPPPLEATPSGPPPSRDFTYFKSLIQQHGGEREENSQQFGGRPSPQLGQSQEQTNNLKPRDSKPRVMKPCIYFNGPRGCRHGANCTFLHDNNASNQQNRMKGTSSSSSSSSDMQGAKRMKFDREITGA